DVDIVEHTRDGEVRSTDTPVVDEDGTTLRGVDDAEPLRPRAGEYLRARRRRDRSDGDHVPGEKSADIRSGVEGRSIIQEVTVVENLIGVDGVARPVVADLDGDGQIPMV